MKVRSTDFRVQQGDRVNLDKWPTAVEPIYESKKQYQKLLRDHVAQLSSLQQLLYASNRYAVLLIFQAMDAAGKDGAIRHVMSGVNPQGCLRSPKGKRLDVVRRGEESTVSSWPFCRGSRILSRAPRWVDARCRNCGAAGRPFTSGIGSELRGDGVDHERSGGTATDDQTTITDILMR